MKNNKLQSGEHTSVKQMVRALSSPDFATVFEQNLKKNTVYVYIDEKLDFVQVFKTLKSAKSFAEGMYDDKINWRRFKDNKNEYVWKLKDVKIFKCLIVSC